MSATRLAQLKETIFTTIAKKANDQKALNLGQGFPNFEGPEWLIEEVRKALGENKNQYAPSPGVLELREALALTFKDFYQLSYCPQTEITVTNGATEALFSSILGHINPGDEVIVFEPFYDSYVSSIRLAGGIPIPVTLKAPDFKFNPGDFSEKLSDKTKMVIINTPHNPSGAMWEKEDFDLFAKEIDGKDIKILSDEVYEFLTYEQKHIPTASHPELKDRTLTISSAGKTFGLTGWKIGWAAGPLALTDPLRMVHQYNSFSVATPLQYAVARGLSRLKTYIPEFQALYKKKRDTLHQGLDELGMNPIMPRGSYFILCQLDENQKDIEECERLLKECNVATIPCSPFYLESKEGEKLLRFCFAKTDDLLQEAITALK